ncbi:hypothetical protein [Endozoicomonas sp.]|uniref:hypothetical protein n=1 Tax=Endozoicomonas sp. TaxID=1892382 RepID=UPI00383B7078
MEPGAANYQAEVSFQDNDNKQPVPGQRRRGRLGFWTEIVAGPGVSAIAESASNGANSISQDNARPSSGFGSDLAKRNITTESCGSFQSYSGRLISDQSDTSENDPRLSKKPRRVDSRMSSTINSNRAESRFVRKNIPDDISRIIKDLLNNKSNDLNKVPAKHRTKKMLEDILQTGGEKIIPDNWLNDYFCNELKALSEFSADLKIYFIKNNYKLSKFNEDLIKRENIEELKKNLNESFWRYLISLITNSSKKRIDVNIHCICQWLDEAPEHLRERAYDRLIKISPDVFRYIPEPYRTEKRSLDACKNAAGNLAYVPEAVINEEMCWVVCKSVKRKIDILKDVPERFRSYRVCLAASIGGGDIFGLVPDDLNEQKILRRAIKEDNLYFEQYSGKIGYSIWLYIAVERFDAFSHLPEEYQTTAFYIDVMKDGGSMKYIPKKLSNKELYKTAMMHGYKRSRECSLADVPESSRDLDLCLTAVEYNALTSNPLQQITYIPQNIRQQLTPLTTPASGSTDEDKNRFKKALRCYLLRSKKCQDNLESCTFLHAQYKAELLKSLGSREIVRATMVEPDRLSTNVNPLHTWLYNPLATELVAVCYQAESFAPDLHLVDDLEAFVEQGLKKFITTNKKNYPSSLPIVNEKLLTGSRSIVGGRTLRVSESSTQCYFKLQRKKELLKELMREGFVHQFLDHRNLRSSLASTLPHFKEFVKIPINLLPEIGQFDDPLNLDIEEHDGEKYVNAYHFKASPNYYQYAHQVDSNPEAPPYEKSEMGIYKFMNDAGFFMHHGLLLTSTLPAYHNLEENRPWTFMHGCLGYQGGMHLYPGCFKAWNTTATDRPDIGWDGIRDIGDYEIYGKVQSYFWYRDCNLRTHPQDVNQRICYANCMGEILLAAILLRSRMRRDAPDYHYKNKAAIDSLMQFIETSFNRFLNGLKTEADLQALLSLDGADYHQCLKRAAREILYWTAKQPSESPDEENINRECYSYHIENDMRLCPELYPEDGDVPRLLLYPENFHDKQGKLCLSSRATIFPLLTLTNIIYKTCTEVIETKSC